MANEKILVVDDDVNICELLRLYLEKEGYTVSIVNDGESAVKSFGEIQPDLMLLDIMLPRRLAGLPRDQKILGQADNHAHRKGRDF